MLFLYNLIIIYVKIYCKVRGFSTKKCKMGFSAPPPSDNIRVKLSEYWSLRSHTGLRNHNRIVLRRCRLDSFNNNMAYRDEDSFLDQIF